MDKAIKCLKKRKYEIFHHMEGADGDVWEYCEQNNKDIDEAMSELSIDMETLRQAIHHIAGEYPRLDYDTILKHIKEEL